MTDEFYARARGNSQSTKLQMTQSLQNIAPRLQDITDLPEKEFMRLSKAERQAAFQAARSKLGKQHRLSLAELWNAHLSLKGCT